MGSSGLLISSLMIGGYRSFGKSQKFERFTKVTLLIGPNNSGKSNVLRFVCDVYPHIAKNEAVKLGTLDRHFPNHLPLRFGKCISLAKEANEFAVFRDAILPLFPEKRRNQGLDGPILQAFMRKAE